MTENKRKKTDHRAPAKTNEREEISNELTELGHLQPKHEPMTPNHRETAEKDKYYG
ncbi:hypothetical protein ABZ756_00820 [Mammaliicoccus sciuri]|uniref:Uncharacterized protein n=2 Tax=Sporosarcina newyorkensis TaxID=759851 RepID=A0A1T4XEL4_9BACL|nr:MULTISPECIES: hypothetical protein [Sporosarcina]EGQ27599.1 hypothetical protein HMPREF9372_0345 [Sporosarcina newyorkensis 2681]MBY0220980.1 hypothetical protein [Sporosarcina aquimarina]SKA88022.1 hypothetical protein SAMN04244570_0607 [Sporosarcina newyorkensis]